MKGSRIASFDGYIVAQMIIPITVDQQSDKSVKITGSNYHPDIDLYDGAQPVGKAFSNGFSNGFN